MITDRDIVVRGVADGLDLHRMMVREAMSASAIACSVEHTVEHARALMAANLIKHLPVLDESERSWGSSRCGTSPDSLRGASPTR
jgi:CBS domain-containing protein